VADGIVGAPLEELHRKLADDGAVPRYVGARLGTVRGADGSEIDVEVTFETAPSVLFDAVVIPDGEAGIRALTGVGHAVEFVKDQYRHCKTMLALGKGEQLLDAAGVPAAEKSRGDPGILRMTEGAKATTPFIAAVGKHRHFDRQTDPPLV
jgi:catalase